MRDDTRFWRCIRNSVPVQTMLFMCMSAIVMDVPRCLKQTGVFWFTQPAATAAAVASTVDSSSAAGEPSKPSQLLDPILPVALRVCHHANSSCDQYIWSGVSMNLKVGIGIETMRLLFGHFGQIRRSPLAVLGVFRHKMNWRLVAFLAAYAAVYRVSVVSSHRTQHS